MKLYIVGTGAGNAGGMTLDAQSAIQASDIVVGYTLYVELLRSIFPEKNYLSTGMKSEAERVNLALSEAQNGKTVALICSGDSGVYGMAGLALELSEKYTNIDIEIVPGVTAALSGGALLGAPLGHDFAVISLSDLLTPWDVIEKRLRAAAYGILRWLCITLRRVNVRTISGAPAKFCWSKNPRYDMRYREKHRARGMFKQCSDTFRIT